MTLTARPRLLIRFAVLAALALCGILLALSSTGTPPVGAQDGSLPAKPTGVVATATHDSVALAWDDPDDASITHYQIFRRDRDVHDTGEFVEIDSNTGSAAASYTDDTVEPETRYVYRVKAVNQHGASTWSDFVRADTPAAPDPADLAPGGLEVSLVENRVTLTWDAPASDAASVTGYEILRRRPNDGEAALTTLVADTGNAETGYTDDSANEPGVSYTYRVRALRDGEQSKVSNYARIDLPDDYAQDTPEPEEEPSPEALAPSGLTAAVEDGGVALSWTAPAEDAGSVTGYEVLRAQGSAELATLAADTGNTDTTYTDSGVTGDLDGYRYQVKALRGGDASQGSNVAGVLQSAHAGAIIPLADVTLISNLGQSAGGGGDFSNDQAQAFTTGSNSGGYSLTKVVINSSLGVAADFTVSVHENDSGAPGTSLGTLTKPTLPASAAAGSYEFTHSGIDLAASTTYFIVVDSNTSSASFIIYNTGSDAEDTGGATGWSIGDSSLYRGFGSTGSWTTWAESKKISITGTVKGGTTNSDATGAPTITGTAQVGELLTADISNIGDADGIADADFEYQWIVFDGTADSDISGATGETYRPLLAHLGQTIKVRVTFDDDDDNAESLTSAATAAVTASTYGQVIWAATLTVEEETVSDKTFFGYNLFAGRGSLEPVEFTYDGVAHLVTALQYIEGDTLRISTNHSLGSEDFNLYLDGAPFLMENPGLIVDFSDHGLSWTDEQEVEVRLTVNRPATGAPAITGKPEVGETLTADVSGIMDDDGLPVLGEITYQWISNDGTDDSDIDGATDSTYTLVEADAGKSIKVRVSFTDNAKFPESLTSAATGPVTAAVAALISNVGQTAATGAAQVSTSQSQAQGFTTGSDSGGYTLGSVELAVSSFSGTASDITVSIYSESSGDPGTVVHTLTTPASISAAVTTFTAPSGTTLAASTTYYVVISTTSSGISLSRTDATAEDTGGVSGWSIADSRRFLGGSGWNTTTNPIRMRVNGDAATSTNSPATGAPTITGTPAVGELLTADISNIGDADGIADADFEYRWIANDGTDDSDISGATGETYRPLLAHLGQTIKVRVTFDDDDDNAESLTSAPTAAVTASTYGQVIWSAKMTVETNSIGGIVTLTGFSIESGATTFGELEPNAFSYDSTNVTVIVLYRLTSPSDDYVSLVLDSGLGDGRFILHLDEKPFLIEEAGEQGTSIIIQFEDHGISWSNNEEVEVRLTVNRPATGAPAITGKPEVGETLTADVSGIMDEDGVPAAAQFAYQWISNDGTDDSDIDGATDSTYTLVQADAGKTIKVRVSFTDDAKFPESLTSAATAAVTVPVPALVSNVGQTAAGNANVTATQSQGQGFTTGSDSGGYTLGSVELAVSSFSGTASDITVSIYSESSGDPGTVVHTLTTPASISTPVTTFTAPSGTTLAAGTTYYVVISTTSSGINLSRTNATAEDTGGASGWSIADDRRLFAGGNWVNTSSPIRMRVNGAAASTDIWSATLTVAISGSFYGYSSISGDGDLEPAEFTYNGNPATVQVLAYSGNVFYFRTSPALDSGDYFLFLDDTPIQLGAASGSPPQHQVSDHGLTWTADQQVEVRLALNNAPTGQPVITGTPVVSQTLTADISGIMDEDGVPAADQFAYRWIRSDGATDSDISGATNATYKLGSADLDKTIKVRVTFTDGGGFPERLTSDATGPVTPLTVSSDWSLVPSGLGPGDRFRLMFISSGGRNATPTSIDTYNTWIQNLAAAGHTDIQGYSSAFNVVGSTADVDARDNTGTTYTSSDKGVPIYWLNGNKVADQYQDFYDGGWDEEASMRNQSGSSVSAPIPGIGVWTGSDHDGTESTASMGNRSGFTTVGKPNSGGSDGPLSSDTSRNNSTNKKLYGLSDVFEVEAIEVPADWSLVPSGLNPGDRFRLMFLTTSRNATPTDIDVYNEWVQDRAAGGHDSIREYAGAFNLLGCTEDDAARDNTRTTYTDDDKGVPIYWLNGPKVVDEYEDLYDGDWDQEAKMRTRSGTEMDNPQHVWTGCGHNGTVSSGAWLGHDMPTIGLPDGPEATGGPLSSSLITAKAGSLAVYALSEVFEVAVVAGSNTPATGKPTISGTPQVDQTLTADISSIMDADGLPAAGQFSYQWISDDTDIDGATDSTYTLVEADAGKTITVRVSFTDNANYPESLTSAATVTVLEMVVPEVPFNWSLKPSGLVVGDQFRLIFVSSTGRDASSESIDAYNTWIQSLAAAGHADIQRYYSTFTVVGSTAAVDAQDNTQTTYTSSDKGVPIYWLNGNKVADQYEDFYDGDWDDEANRKTEAGTASSDTTIRTGSDPDGTEKGFGAFSLALGKSLATVGIPDSSATGEGPLSSDTNAADSSTLPLYGLSGVFTVVAPPPTEVPSTWSLVPSGLGGGDEFRLLFVSSTTRTPQATGIGAYNTYVQNRAAAGHTDIRDFSSTFAAVGCTAAMDARDNTYTTYTSSDKGVPIYWLNGNKVVDQYEDFYDGGWDDEANPKTEAGASTSATTIWTGCDEDGTEAIHIGGTASRALGTFSVAFGDLDHATLGPVGHPNNIGGNALSKPVYGLSAVFRVAPAPPTVVPSDWSLIPSGLGAGDEFRLLFLSSTKRSIRSTNISDYNTFVQNRAAAGHTDIQDYSDTFRVLGSTDAKDARDNTGTTYTSSDKGVRIYWLNGDKAADQYQDFYDGSWDQQADAWNESGVEYDLSARRYVATGSSRDGTTEQSNPLGASSGEVQLGCLYQTSSVNGPVFCRFTTENITADDNQQLYGLSGVFQVTSNNPASGAPTISGTLEVRQTLTADISGIMDGDGLPFLIQFSYQWIRSDGTDDSDISGATDSTYTLEDADQGKTIKVRVTFTDEGGTEETLTSDSTTAVAADTTGPVVEEVICFDSLCNLVFDELLDENLNNVPLTIAFAITADGAAITVGIAFPLIDGRFQVSSLAPQIRQGQTVKVVYTDPTGGDDTKAIQDAAGNDAADFTTGEDGVPAVTNDSTLARVAPGAPTGLTATPNGATQIDLAWTAPADNGGDAITGYQIEYSDDAGTSWSVLDPDTQSTDTLYSDITLTGGETRHYRVSAINSIGTGAASNSPPTGKPVITGTPEVKQTLTADISGIVDADGLPADDQFSYQWVRNDGTDHSDISGATDSTYLLKAADLGKTIKVRATFTDEGGAEETLTSGATTAVAADTTGPILTEAYIEGPSGNRAILVFDEILDATNQAAVGDFEVTADGAPIAIGGATVTNLSRDRVFLTSLSPVIYQGQTVTVTYTDPTSSNDANALQDEAGNDAASFATGEDDVPAVTNDSTVEPSTVALVSNKNRMIESAISRTIQAQSFVTGPSTGGYTLSTIQIRLGDDSALPGVTDLIAAIKADDGSGEPGALVANLANPASLTNDALNTFTAPTGTVLAPDTTYWVVVNEERSDTDRVNLRVTAQDEEDEAFPGWSIGNNHLSKVSESGSWNHSATVSNLIVVSGSVVVGTADTTGPILTEAYIEGPSGNRAILVFDEILDATNQAAVGDFEVTADGAPIAIGGATVTNLSRDRVFLTSLSPVIYQGQTVTVTYTDPTSSNDANAIQDEAGNDAASFTTGEDGVPAVTNNSTVAPVAPGAPTGLTATASGGTQIDLAWTAPADNGGDAITGYQIEYSDDAGTSWSVLVADTQSTDTMYSDTTLSGGETRHYRVSAINSIGTGAASAAVTGPTVTGPVTVVPADWSLIPSGLGPGDHFRLIFLSSAMRTAEATDIATYNTWVQGLAANGHTDIQDHSSTFRVVGSTAAVNARDNTSTTGTGVAIHWLNGDKAADDYEDFYDETWDEEASMRDESGTTVTAPTYVWTGSDDDGTTTNWHLGSNLGNVTVGIPNSTSTGNGPLSSGVANVITLDRHLYALSGVFQVSLITEVPADWSLVPSGLQEGDQFRLLFISSAHRNASPSEIATYNTWIQARAANGHTDIQDYSSSFRAVGSTEDMDARDNTGTTYTSSDKGVAIYWLNGNKVADDYEDFYDEDWDEEAAMTNESGTAESGVSAWTGSDHDGTEMLQGTPETSRALGNSNNAWVRFGKTDSASHGPLSGATANRTGNKRIYGLSGVFEVVAGNNPATGTVTSGSITQTSAVITVTIANPDTNTQTVNLQYKRNADTNWTSGGARSTVSAAVTFTLTGLTGNTEYEVEASLDSAFASGVKTAAFTTSPTKPGKTRSVDVTTSGNGTLFITWQAPDSDGGSAITGYKVQWKSGSQSFGDPSREHTTEDTFPDYLITGLTNGTEYTVRVIAVNAVGDGPPSDTDSGTPEGPPDAPPNVQAGSGYQQLTVSWGAPNDGGSAITEYTLQWKSGTQSYNTTSRQATVTTTTHTIPSLSNGTEYTVRVRATNASGDSGWSAEAKGTPREGPHVSTVRVKEPISCTVTFVALEFVNLEAATEYQAHLRFRVQGSSSWTVLSPQGFWSSGLPSGAGRGELNGPSPAFTLTDLAYETAYEVQAALDSGFVDGLATTTFSTPNLSEVGLTPLSPGDGTLGLRMTRPTSEGRVDGYVLQWKSGDEEYDDTDTSERQADVPGPGDREYTITGLDNGVEYTVRAMAYNDNGVGVPSSEVRGTPEAPPNRPARGAPTISGTAQVGETLTADTGGIEDDDGLADAVYSYQWLADDADIAGATSDTYTPVADDVGKAIKVKVSFRDDRNHQESLTSAATAAVEADPDAPTEPPNAPRTVRIVGDTNTSLTLTWDAPDGGTAVTEYRVQWLTVGEGFANARRDGREAVVDASARSHTITGLTKYGFYQVRVLAVNGAGESERSNTAWGFPGLGEGQYGHG